MSLKKKALSFSLLWILFPSCLLADVGETQHTEPEHIVSEQANSPATVDAKAFHIEQGTALAERIELERQGWYNQFVITPHRPNYIIPFSFNTSPNQEPFSALSEEFLGDDSAFNLDNLEIEFQLSLKVVLAEQLFNHPAFLYAAYTTRSFWQAYNSDISSPFRETNYEPELGLSLPGGLNVLGFTNIANSIVFNHQSNGQAGPLSRSWNRIMFSSTFQRGNLLLKLSPWYRIPESEEVDDNPDIDDFLGHFSLRSTYKWHDKTFSAIWRNNLQSDNRGSIDVSFSYPLSKRLRGYVKYFNGYGMSLIDYDDYGESLGFGLVLSDWL